LNIIHHDIVFLDQDSSGATLAREKLVTKKIDVLLNLLRATPRDHKNECISEREEKREK